MDWRLFRLLGSKISKAIFFDNVGIENKISEIDFCDNQYVSSRGFGISLLTYRNLF